MAASHTQQITLNSIRVPLDLHKFIIQTEFRSADMSINDPPIHVQALRIHQLLDEMWLLIPNNRICSYHLSWEKLIRKLDRSFGVSFTPETAELGWICPPPADNLAENYCTVVDEVSFHNAVSILQSQIGSNNNVGKIILLFWSPKPSKPVLPAPPPMAHSSITETPTQIDRGQAADNKQRATPTVAETPTQLNQEQAADNKQHAETAKPDETVKLNTPQQEKDSVVPSSKCAINISNNDHSTLDGVGKGKDRSYEEDDREQSEKSGDSEEEAAESGEETKDDTDKENGLPSGLDLGLPPTDDAKIPLNNNLWGTDDEKIININVMLDKFGNEDDEPPVQQEDEDDDEFEMRVRDWEQAKAEEELRR